MAVCLHCGEPGPPGALFCTKCGYTLPQGDAVPPPAILSPTPPPVAAPAPARSSLPPVNAPFPVLVHAVPYIAPAASIPGAMGAVPPPPNAKYCTRCGTMIAQPAVYCPVCQQPQP